VSSLLPRISSVYNTGTLA